MGRMLTFLARAEVDLNIPQHRSLGIDEQSALLLDVQTGIARAVGKGVGGFICNSAVPPSTCKVGTALEFGGKCFRDSTSSVRS
jgi:cyanophycinase-like exopeptidase